MTRRGLLSFFTRAAAVAVVVDPEQLLWVPGKKLISIPSPGLALEEPFVVSASDSLQLMIEKVRPKLEELFRDYNRTTELLRLGVPISVDGHNFKIPILRR